MSKKQQKQKNHLAFWRYEQIEQTCVDDLTRAERFKIMLRLSNTPVLWPSGQTKAVTLATAYRWYHLYKHGGLEALQTKQRCDQGVHRSKLPDNVVQEALRKLTVDPGLSLTFLLAILRPLFPNVIIPRSTLQKRLIAHPDYKRILRLKTHTKRRTRFVAKEPHLIWHTDAKGPISIVLESKKKLAFHILTILDDASRAVLAAIVVPSPNLGAAVKVFRMAANRFGLPNKLYADRASIFDSKAFRMGLAQIGTHRIYAKPRNPEANGKIEAYHRTLVMWFTDRLPKQVVVDFLHLQQLLDGVIYGLYQTHKHRGLKTSPQTALANCVSKRMVPPTRLVDAFLFEKLLKAHPKTGEVEIYGITYLVQDELRGQKLTFLIDPAGEALPLVKHPSSGVRLPLIRATIKPADITSSSADDPQPKWGIGNLQAIYDTWQGKKRPLAEPGFGLPELYVLLAKVCGRTVPASDAEAALIQQAYANLGPLPKIATEKTFASIATLLGQGRPVKAYLDALEKNIQEEQRKQ